MNKREQFKKAVIMGNHPGLSYEEAVMKEAELSKFIGKTKIECLNCGREEAYYAHGIKRCNYCVASHRVRGFSITIGRVMQALDGIKKGKDRMVVTCRGQIEYRKNFPYRVGYLVTWQLTKDGKELTDDDQSDETIEALLKLLQS